jgi:hypothetical protein
VSEVTQLTIHSSTDLCHNFCEMGAGPDFWKERFATEVFKHRSTVLISTEAYPGA